MNIKVTFCLRRLTCLSKDAFQHYWRTIHAPLVCELQPDLRIARYVQSYPHQNDAPSLGIQRSRGAPVGFDGVAEIWWQCEQDLRVAIESPAGRRASKLLLEDEQRFIDLAQSPIWFAMENEIIAPRR